MRRTEEIKELAIDIMKKQIAMLKMMSTLDRDAQRIKDEHANTIYTYIK
ncbi:MAG: hypothetical protein ACJ704_11985 [Nitrososphaeraceae archaeon]